jgi:excinuclease ABC subunit C
MLAHRLEFVPERDAEIFSAVPAAPAVFMLRATEPEQQPYVSKTANLRRRLIRLLGRPDEQGRRLNLRDRVAHIEFTPSGSDFESGLLLYQLLRRTFPENYARRMKFRFAPLVRMHMENAYPRASITTRLGKLGGRSLYYGPFPSRSAAEKFANDSLDFFKMRRCVDDLHPDPAFPGCIYSEMKMCLAPCFRGCTDDEYSAEVARVQAYFESGGHSLVRELSTARDQASANLEFETAAATHARLEKLAPVLNQRPEIVRRLDRLAAVIVQRSAEPGSVAIFKVESGCLSGPITFAVAPSAEQAGKSQSMESRLQDALGGFPTAVPSSVIERMEHLAILKRWYYRSSRLGEIFLADEKGTVPLRRIVRGISRVYRGEKPENAVPMSTGNVGPSIPEQRGSNNEIQK